MHVPRKRVLSAALRRLAELRAATGAVIHRGLKRDIVRGLYPLLIPDRLDSAHIAGPERFNACGDTPLRSPKEGRVHGRRPKIR